MMTTAITTPFPEEVLPRWLEELQASDRTKGTIRRYRSAVEGFFTWYSREEQRPLTFSTLTPHRPSRLTSAHTLRHTFARNYLAEHPGDIVGLTSILGHTSLDTTRIYSQPTIEQLSKRIEQLPQNAYDY